jgi:hypothetical protein
MGEHAAVRQHLTKTVRIAPLVLLVGWATAVSAGFGVLLRYKATPGDAGSPPARWPSASRLPRASDQGATLVLFAHPHCPCTHASMSELARLAADAPGFDAVVALVRPSGATEDWDDTELRRRAAAIPGATVVFDDEGAEAERFRAAVSGFAVLYDREGRLRFKGGLTSARGHEGDSFGRRRVLAVLSGGSPDRNDAPVFGCALGVTPHDASLEAGGMH